MNYDTPLLSIICPTYNHEGYIRQTIEGFLVQKTNFKFEIIVHDDASTDNTAKVLREYEKRFPELFRNIYQTENQLSQSISSVSRICFQAARGKYIALCEGDDYWTDPHKLQKQVDFLEAHPEITVSYHSIHIETSPSLIKEKYIPKILRTESGVFNFFQSLQGKNGSTLSMMFRSNCLNYVPKSIFDDLNMGDWPLECICTILGSGYVHHDIMGVYRIHEGGITNKFKKIYFYDSRIIFSKRLLHLNISSTYKIFINEFIFRIYILKCIYLLENKHILEAFKSLMNSMFYIRIKRVNKLYSWDEKYCLNNAILRVLNKIKYKVFPRLSALNL